MDIKEYRYKTELHMHTKPASGCGHVFPEDAVELYAAKEYDSLVICNHFTYKQCTMGDKKQVIATYLEDYERAIRAAKKYDINIILGCEARVSENINDYLLFGIDEEDLSVVYELLNESFEEFSRAFRNEKRIIVQAHPFRDEMTLVDHQLLDGIEIFNMHPRHNSRNGVASQYASDKPFILTCGSDFHRVQDAGLSAMLTKTKMKDSHDIASVLKNGDYVLEIGGNIIIPKNSKEYK